jgi:GH24 family phage-related lysozyme (muramidase)
MNKNNRLNWRTFGILVLGAVVFLLMLSGIKSLVVNTTTLEADSPYSSAMFLVEIGASFFLTTIAFAVAYLSIRMFFRNTLGAFLKGDGFDEAWDSFQPRQKLDRVLVVFIVIVVGLIMGRAQAATLPVSEDGFDLITHYEVGGQSYYNKRLMRPTVPAPRTTRSGVTVGMGYDCGWNTKSQIRESCEGILDEDEIRALQSVSGLKGMSAYYALGSVKYRVDVTWDQAEEIFRRDSVPRFSRLTENAFKLDLYPQHPHVNGALLSLVFNRGSSINYGNRRKEMAWIRHNISIGRADRIPSNLRSMKVHWSYSKLRGLHLRRDAEAGLAQKGIDLVRAGWVCPD